MMRRLPTLRSVRKPVLALVAAAGLVVWTEAGAAPTTLAAVPVVPGQAAISAVGYAPTPALKTTGVVTPGGLFEAGKVQPPRPHGGGTPFAGAGDDPLRGQHTFAPMAHEADLATFHVLALSRAGRDAAPPMAPPTFPS